MNVARSDGRTVTAGAGVVGAEQLVPRVGRHRGELGGFADRDGVVQLGELAGDAGGPLGERGLDEERLGARVAQLVGEVLALVRRVDRHGHGAGAHDAPPGEHRLRRSSPPAWPPGRPGRCRASARALARRLATDATSPALTLAPTTSRYSPSGSSVEAAVEQVEHGRPGLRDPHCAGPCSHALNGSSLRRTTVQSGVRATALVSDGASDAADHPRGAGQGRRAVRRRRGARRRRAPALLPSWPSGPTRSPGRCSPPASSRATASPSGATTPPSGCSPPSAPTAAGAVVVTINTRFKGVEAAHMLETAGARLLFTVNGFLDTDYVAMLDAAGRPACSRRSWCSTATDRRRHPVDRLPRASGEGAGERGRRASRGGRARRHQRHPLHLRHHREAEGRDARPRGRRSGRSRRGATWWASGPATATSSSTRSSTPSGSRPGSWPAC